MDKPKTKMKSVLSVCLLTIGLCTITHGHHINGHDDTSVAAAKIYTNTAQFGLNLLEQISSASPGKNVFFSPLIISSALSLLSLGARSTTHTQILEGLTFNLTQIQEKDIHDGFHNLFSVLTNPDSKVKLDIGQALFVKDGQNLLQKFLDDVHASYEADVLSAKFQEPTEAEKQINEYVEKKTHGKIPQLVKGLDQNTVLVLVNYIFFKGNWEKPFDPEMTREGDFIVDDKTTVKVPMMQRMGWFHYYFDHELSCTVVQMHYNGNATAFFVLPDPGKMKELEKAISRDVLTKWSARVHRDTARVHLPKFNISTSCDLKGPLTNLGIAEMFSDNADLTGITGQALKVSKVTHKAVLTIDEIGTEAAAATAVEAIPMSLPPTIIFNGPFLFLVYDQVTNSTLFIGKIVNPTES
ncbi:alpha-1-antitrypsin isoform X2 [Anolis carolinensis]|uniref:Serpin domain-containing protein n=1 Tax=Anolis carolinensis TaxID=28377 RepID=A0A803T106_ANOCA|nr:PREDICTED: alpha-1-antitrypsin isoform X2 [Anolis carolinensis]|eukprot:XP_008105287.1 PREDICTED: alpha-1-antitrypsin isoform X2 [Anolis carolinensis]